MGAGLCVAVAVCLVVIISIPPMVVRPRGLEAVLADRLGLPVKIAGASWRLDPWPLLEIRGALAHPSLSERYSLTVEVDRARLRALSAFGLGARAAVGFAELSGISLRLGELALRDGLLSLARSGDVVNVTGHAFGLQGGSLDLAGQIRLDRLSGAPIRIYLTGLEIPIPASVGSLLEGGSGSVSVSGVVTISDDGEAGEAVDIDIHAEGRSSNRSGSWLEAEIRGRLLRRNDRFDPAGDLRVAVTLRQLDSGRDMRVLHGKTEIRVQLEGDLHSGRVLAEADLTDLRLRLGSLLEKTAGGPAEIQLESEWRRGGAPQTHVEISLGGPGLVLDLSSGDAGGQVKLGTRGLTLGALAAHVPAVRGLARIADAQIDVDATWSANEGLLGVAKLQSLVSQLDGRSLSLPLGVVDFSTDLVRVFAPGLSVEGQRVDLAGEIDWSPPSGPVYVRLAVRAGDLDLEPLAALLFPSIVGMNAGVPTSTEYRAVSIALAAVNELRARPRLLDRLHVEPAIFEVGHLSGLGITAEKTEYRLALSDQVLRIEQRTLGAKRPSSTLELQLEGWVARLESR